MSDFENAFERLAEKVGNLSPIRHLYRDEEAGKSAEMAPEPRKDGTRKDFAAENKRLLLGKREKKSNKNQFKIKKEKNGDPRGPRLRENTSQRGKILTLDTLMKSQERSFLLHKENERLKAKLSKSFSLIKNLYNAYRRKKKENVNLSQRLKAAWTESSDLKIWIKKLKKRLEHRERALGMMKRSEDCCEILYPKNSHKKKIDQKYCKSRLAGYLGEQEGKEDTNLDDSMLQEVKAIDFVQSQVKLQKRQISDLQNLCLKNLGQIAKLSARRRPDSRRLSFTHNSKKDPQNHPKISSSVIRQSQKNLELARTPSRLAPSNKLSNGGSWVNCTTGREQSILESIRSGDRMRTLPRSTRPFRSITPSKCRTQRETGLLRKRLKLG